MIEIKQKIKQLKQSMLVYVNNTRNASYKIIENLNSEIETTPVNKKLKYEPDITDTELVQCEIKTSALRKKK